jgi:hypothetical protein
MILRYFGSSGGNGFIISDSLDLAVSKVDIVEKMSHHGQLYRDCVSVRLLLHLDFRTHFWQDHNECVVICRGLGIRNPAVCFLKWSIRLLLNWFIDPF